MLTVTRRAGRLVAIHIASPITESELTAFEIELGAIVALSRSIVFWTDLRQAQVLGEAHAARLVSIMRGDNRKVLRTALLLPEGNAILALQFERIVREAANPARRIFRDRSAAMRWLLEVLEPEEQMSVANLAASSGRAVPAEL